MALVDGGTQRFPRVVGLSRALEMILMARGVDSTEAESWGFVNRVVEDDEAVDLGYGTTAFPHETLRSVQQAVFDGLGIPLDRGLKLQVCHGTKVLDKAEARRVRFHDEREKAPDVDVRFSRLSVE